MTTTPAPRIPVYLDCDTGIDDSLAIAYLLASPEAEIVGIGAVSGNVSAARGAINTLDLLALAGHSQIPVAIGAHHPVAGTFGGGAPHVHGANGIGDVILPPSGLEPIDESAAELLIRLSREYEGELRVLAIGPCTNLAEALRLDPTLTERVHGVTVMGGAALTPGNVTPVAEANIWNDPEAAAAVMEADWDVVLVPLDVTEENVFEESDRETLLAAESPFARALGEILDVYYDFYVVVYGRRSCALHDPLAAAIVVGGITATRAPAVPVVVDTTQGPGRGQTICDLRGQRFGPVDRVGRRTRVVLDTDRKLAAHLVERILAFTPGVPAVV